MTLAAVAAMQCAERKELPSVRLANAISVHETAGGKPFESSSESRERAGCLLKRLLRRYRHTGAFVCADVLYSLYSARYSNFAM